MSSKVKEANEGVTPEQKEFSSFSKRGSNQKKMTVPASWEFHNRESDKTLRVHICPRGDDLSGIAIRINQR